MLGTINAFYLDRLNKFGFASNVAEVLENITALYSFLSHKEEHSKIEFLKHLILFM